MKEAEDKAKQRAQAQAKMEVESAKKEENDRIADGCALFKMRQVPRAVIRGRVSLVLEDTT